MRLNARIEAGRGGVVMNFFAGTARTPGIFLVMLALFASFAFAATSASAALDEPFAGLAGRWVGEGRLGFKDGKGETVKCRATYFVSDNLQELKQNIRCASAGGKIEVQSTITSQGGALSGSWTETIYNISGAITGKITPKGYQVAVTSADLAANMEIVVRDARQIVEIQFHHASLVGLTLILTKG